MLFRSYIVEALVRFTSLSEASVSLLLIIVIGYIFLFFVLLKIHRRMTAKQRKRVRACIYEYDRIWYATAKSMYAFNKEMKLAGKENKLVHGTRSILSLKDKDYLHNQKKIFSDLIKLEKFLWKQVIDPKVLKKISRLHLTITSFNVFHKIVGWILTIMTLWIYLIFWKRVYYR